MKSSLSGLMVKPAPGRPRPSCRRRPRSRCPCPTRWTARRTARCPGCRPWASSSCHRGTTARRTRICPCRPRSDCPGGLRRRRSADLLVQALGPGDLVDERKAADELPLCGRARKKPLRSAVPAALMVLPPSGSRRRSASLTPSKSQPSCGVDWCHLDRAVPVPQARGGIQVVAGTQVSSTAPGCRCRTAASRCPDRSNRPARAPRRRSSTGRPASPASPPEMPASTFLPSFHT